MTFEQQPPLPESSPSTNGEKKVQEYIERIRNGEAAAEIMNGLPAVFRSAIERGLQNQESQTSEHVSINNEHAEFKNTNGETQEGFWWHSFRNQSAKRLKESGEFEWGKERLYFDIPYADFEKLKKALIRIASEHSIPLAFKYVDAEKTYTYNMDGVETRFVANFASVEDAKRIYDLLRNDTEYQSIVPDRRLDYSGLRVDALTEYSGGFREQREPLKRIINAQPTKSGTYAYEAPSGKRIEITKNEYAHFKNMYDELTKKIAQAEVLWQQ